MNGMQAVGLWTDDQLDEVAPEAEGEVGSLLRRFVVPPFTVLDSRQGYWQERKRWWIAKGIKGELGRGNVLRFSENVNDRFHNGAGPLASPGRCFGQDLMKGEHVLGSTNPGSRNDRRVGLPFTESYDGGYAWRSHSPESENGSAEGTGTSVFDPVLCEIVYRWFCPVGGSVLDPFAGESTKGIVAALLGRSYTGIELRQDQIDANQRQADAIGCSPTWLQGDSATVGRIVPKAQRFDLIFTSPPYYDLEVYSDHDADGSAMQTYGEFMAFYRHVFAQCVSRLKPNRFLVVKVGEIRDERGICRNFVGDNIDVFRDLGLHLYNEAILITPAGSLPVRVGKQFVSGRKLGKSHQNILCFYNGDPKRVREEFGDVDMD